MLDERLVVEVDRVLGGEHEAEPEGAGLLEQGEQRRLGRRVGRVRRQEAEHLVEVEERAQLGGPRLRAQPAAHALGDQRDDEQPLGVAEVGDGDDRQARPAAGGGRAQSIDVERLALEEAGEGRRGEQVVERLARTGAVARRVGALERQRAEAVEAAASGHRRRASASARSRPGRPGALDHPRDQHRLARAHRIGIEPGEREQPPGDASRSPRGARRRGVPAAGG